MMMSINRKHFVGLFANLKTRQGIKVGKFTIDPVHAVIILFILFYSVGSDKLERFIYWIEITSTEMMYQRDLSNDPMGVMRDSLNEYANSNIHNTDNVVELFVDGVTTYKYLESRFEVRLLVRDDAYKGCWLSVKGELEDPTGTIDPDEISFAFWCVKNTREVKVSEVSIDSFHNLPASDDQPWRKRFAINREDTGFIKLSKTPRY